MEPKKKFKQTAKAPKLARPKPVARTIDDRPSFVPGLAEAFKRMAREGARA
jgi:hypothetical protein